MNLQTPGWPFFSFFRHKVQKGIYRPHAIDNCFEWEFKCPMEMGQLKRTDDDNVDFCPKCKKNVYLVHDTEELGEKVCQN